MYSDQDILGEFKALSLDSAAINYKEYPEIFHDAFKTVFEDTLMVIQFESYCEKNNISLEEPKSLFTLVGAFHKWLNGQEVDISSLDLYMESLYEKYIEAVILEDSLRMERNKLE